MYIDKTLLQLRLIARKNGKYIMNKLFSDYLTGHVDKKRTISCLLCGLESNITKEHVLPKWVFENDPTRTFITDVNQLPQKYIGTTLPMCSICNTEILNALELYIQRTISEVDLKTKYYTSENWENIIRWLEIIDFKSLLSEENQKLKNI